MSHRFTASPALYARLVRVLTHHDHLEGGTGEHLDRTQRVAQPVAVVTVVDGGRA